MKDLNEIKKALYKQKPIAEFGYIRENIWNYSTEVVIDNEEIIVEFAVPRDDMGEKSFDLKMEAQLLIRWIDLT